MTDSLEKIPGDRMEDGSYYMGVSDDTHADFYLFIESAGSSKTADVVTFDESTKFLSDGHKKKETFHGCIFSAFQLECEIIQSYKDGAADGGISRLTTKELAQVEKTFKAKSELRTEALKVCASDPWVHSASPHVNGRTWSHDLGTGERIAGGASTVTASLLLGRRDSQPK